MKKQSSQQTNKAFPPEVKVNNRLHDTNEKQPAVLGLEDPFPTLCNYNSVQMEVSGLDVRGRDMCPCKQMSMHTCACLYISMWNPEINVQTSSSSVSDVPSNTGSTDLTTSGFPLGVGAESSGPQVCAAGALPTEPSP